MASCWSGCWTGFTDSLRSLRRTLYLAGPGSGNRARYNEAKATVEFETLIDDDDCEFETAPSFTRRLLTEEEQYLVNQRRYDQLVHKQRQIDHEIDAQLRNEEDKIRREEEALYEAKRQAARAAKQSRNYEEKKPSYQNNAQVNSKLSENTTLSSWTSDDGLSIDSAELDAEDFDSFLEKVKARSLNPSKQTGATTSTTAVSNGVIANGWDSFTNSVEPTKAVGKSSIDAFKILDLSPVESDDRATDVDR